MDTQKTKAKIEAMLYCLPQGISTRKLSQVISADAELVRALLIDLQKEYAERSSGLQIEHINKAWMFKVPDDFTEIIKEAAEPELDKAVLETLAYIAWRKGSRQCDVVRVRSNKAYNHIKLLKEMGLIDSSRAGLSKWLEPTKKFYEYFNLENGVELKVPEKKEETTQLELDEVKQPDVTTENTSTVGEQAKAEGGTGQTDTQTSGSAATSSETAKDEDNKTNV